MDFEKLHVLLRPLVVALGQSNGHKDIPEICRQLGLPVTEEGSKRERMEASFDALPESDLPQLAERYLRYRTPTAEKRNAIQDWLWSSEQHPPIPKKVRREIARAYDIENLYFKAERFSTLLDSLWVLDSEWSASFGGGLREEIAQHVFRNPGDWTAEDLFDKLGAFDAPDRRFALFLEGLASPENLTDEPAQRRFVESVNNYLLVTGVEMRETGADGGYPIFTVHAIGAAWNRPPKNLIFASSVKPDIRFRSAVDNDIEIVTNADKVLVYDKPIGNDGLRWKDLQQWWGETNDVANEQKAKEQLYRRLEHSLPQDSPPQKALFDAYYRGFNSAVPLLPALLPEVWLHWDPKTVKERGPDALLRFRMDFLLLLPQGVRVVIEVDGKQHYADSAGSADVRRYAQLVEGDRELKLSGYEVFRFGGAELRDNAGSKVKSFFEALFKLYRVPVPLHEPGR